MLIPNEVIHIINTLNYNGYETFIVGGCTRDLILNKVPKDWDITTSANPDTIISLFDKTIPTGIKHGTITVILNNKSFEVTTYRCNERYTNHRKPDSVSFSSSLKEDLTRRDFTMNAIAYSEKTGFVDLFDGISDIQNKIIKCIGNSDERFCEDALRMLRAIRFSSTLGFSIEEKTFCSICKNSALINSISGERISQELQKIIMGEYSDQFILLYETQLLQNLFPFVKNHKDIIIDALKKMSASDYDLELRLCILICFVIHKLQSKQYLEQIFDRLKFSKKIKKLVCTMYQYYDYNFSDYNLDTKILLNKIGKQNFIKLLEFYKHVNSREIYDKILNVYNDITKNNHPIFISDLKISGNNLINIGIKNIEVGNTLKYLLNHCFKHPNDNKKEILIKLAKEYQAQR